MIELRVRTTSVPLTKPFVISRGSQSVADVVHVSLALDDAIGWGEGCPATAVTGDTVDRTIAALAEVDPAVLDPDDIEGSLSEIAHLPTTARCCIDLVLHDLAGKLTGAPAHELLDLPAGTRPTAATVIFGDAKTAREEARAWTRQGFRVLKVKLGRPDPLELARAVREAAPDAEIWVDGNEAFTADEVLVLLPKLEALGVTLVEQPLKRADTSGLRRLLREDVLPIFLDEAVQGPSEVAALAPLEGRLGVNVKVQKVGGLVAAKRCVDEAHAQRREVLVGCNIETGLGIAGGCVLVGAVERADLDGNLFLAHDPFPLPRPAPGLVGTLDGPGLGVVPDPKLLPDL